MAEVSKEFWPDLIVVATFPKIISAEILGAARLGALNMHMSLLPRHRGPDPLFWTYYWDNDRDAGMTIGSDGRAGAMPATSPPSRRCRLSAASPRARPTCGLPRSGSICSPGVLGRIAARHASRVPQDGRGSRPMSSPPTGRAPVLPSRSGRPERVWHVLRGLGRPVQRPCCGFGGRAASAWARHRLSADE